MTGSVHRDHRRSLRTADQIRYDPFVNPQRDCPHPVWSRIRSASPVMFSEELQAWVITTYDLVRLVLAEPATFINAHARVPVTPPPNDVLAILQRGMPARELRSTLTLDGAEHRRVHRFLVAALNPRRIGDVESSARETAAALIRSFAGQGSADLVHDFSYKLPLTVIVDLMNLPRADIHRLHDWSSQRMALQWGRLDRDAHVAAAESYLEFQQYLLSSVQQRRGSPRDDLISELITRSQDEHQPFTDGEVVGIMLGLVAAGHETSMNFISLTVLHCLQQPGRWASLATDPSLIPALLEESLRFDSPAQAIWRTAARDTTIGRTHLKAGARILLVLGSANRDPAVFTDPDIFTPERSRDIGHLAFGKGPHSCVGAALARLEGRIALEELVTRLPGLALANGFDATFRPNAVQRFLTSLQVRWPVADSITHPVER